MSYLDQSLPGSRIGGTYQVTWLSLLELDRHARQRRFRKLLHSGAFPLEILSMDHDSVEATNARREIAWNGGFQDGSSLCDETGGGEPEEVGVGDHEKWRKLIAKFEQLLRQDQNGRSDIEQPRSSPARLWASVPTA